EARTQNKRPDLDPLRDGRYRTHDRPRLVHALDRTCVRLVEEVVEHPDGVEPSLLRRQREGSDGRPTGRGPLAVTLCRGEDHADLHALECRAARSVGLPPKTRIESFAPGGAGLGAVEDAMSRRAADP